MKNYSNDTVICSACDRQFDSEGHGESVAFDHHDCPMTVEPIKGESFEDYSARCDAFKAEQGR